MVLMLAALIAIQLPAVQRWVARKVIAALEEKTIDGKITFEDISIHPLKGLALNGITVTDNHPYVDPYGRPRIDTLARAGSVVMTFSIKSLLFGDGLEVRRASMRDIEFNMTRYPNPGDSTSSVNFMRVFGLYNDKDEKPFTGKLFSASKVEADNVRVRFIDYTTPPQVLPEGSVNLSDLDMVLDFKGHDASYEGQVLRVTADDIRLREKSGYSCDHLSSGFSMSPTEMRFTDLHLEDPWSDIILEHLDLNYKSLDDFSDFFNLIQLDGRVLPSRIDSRTAGYFLQFVQGMELELLAAGSFDGVMSDLNIRDMSFTETKSNVGGKLNLNLNGIPDPNALIVNARTDGIRFTTSGLNKLIKGLVPGLDVNLRDIATDQAFLFQGEVEGMLDDLDIDGLLRSGKGTLTADAYVRGAFSGEGLALGGSINAKEFPLGTLLGTGMLGDCTLRTHINSYFNDNHISADFDTLVVDRIHLAGYDYRDIIGKGSVRDNSFDGRIASLDPEANFIFEGFATLPRKNAEGRYDFDLTVGGLDLHRLGYDAKDRADIMLHSRVNFRTSVDGTVRGRIDIDTLLLKDNAGSYPVGSIRIRAQDGANDIRLQSSLMTAKFAGSASIMQFIDDLKALTVGAELPLLSDKPITPWSGADYTIDASVKDVSPVLDFFVPGLYVETDTRFHAGIDKEGKVSARLNSPGIAYGKHYIMKAKLYFSSGESGLRCHLSGNRMDIGGIEMLNPSALALADDNLLAADFSFDNHSTPESKANLLISGGLSRTEQDSLLISVRFDPSTSIAYEGDTWHIASSDCVFGRGRFKIDDSIRAESGDQWIEIRGGLSPTLEDELSLDMQDFDITPINTVLPFDFRFEGRAFGQARILSPYQDSFGLLAELESRDTKIAGRDAGRVDIGSRWDAEARSFVFDVRNDLRGSETFRFDGRLYTDDGRLDGVMTLDSLDAGYFSTFVEGIASDISGELEGRIRAYGPLSRLSFTSEGTRVKNGRFKFDYTGVTYNLNGPVGFSEAGLTLNGSTLTDGGSGRGDVEGGIYYDHFDDLSIGLTVGKIRGLKALDLGPTDNESMWGTCNMNGNVSVKGPLEHIVVRVVGETAGTGNLHLPLNYSTDSSSGLLVFKEDKPAPPPPPKDRFEERILKARQEVTEETILDLSMRVRAHPEVEAYIEIDPSTGNVMNGRGSGNIELDYSSASGILTMGGDYTVSGGKFRVSAMNLASREFEIEDGGTIRFNGDVMDTELDIDAVYKTKASLSTLLSDSTVVRTPVHCLIGITDRLRDPAVNLAIEFPEITDPTTKMRAESALNTQDQIQKQFLSLLISGTFLPAEQSGIFNNSNTSLLSNVTDVMSSQLNSILQQLEIPLDLGFNYQSTDSGNDLFDVAVSTQLFNDRVTINGNFGNRQYGNSGLTGDLEVDIKAGRRGLVNFNLFSRSSDIYKGDLDNLQRNGAGITVQRDFSSFKQLMQNTFGSSATRQESQRQELEQATREERTVITISPDDQAR